MANLEEIDLDALIKKIVHKVRDEILREILGDVVKALKSLINVVMDLVEAQKETEKRLNELTRTVNMLAEEVTKLTRTVNTLSGKVARLEGAFIEDRVINDLAFALTRRGFDVYRHFPGIPYVDAVVEFDNFIALLQICKKCDLDDIRQLNRGAQAFEKIEGVKPDVLVLFSYTGEIDEDVFEEAAKKNIIVEKSTRSLVKKLLKIANKRKTDLSTNSKHKNEL